MLDTKLVHRTIVGMWRLLPTALICLLAACGGGGGGGSSGTPGAGGGGGATTYTIGGTVSGLANAESVALLDNGADSLTVNQNGAFTFHTALTFGNAYSVTVGTSPAGQKCAVLSGSGLWGSQMSRRSRSFVQQHMLGRGWVDRTLDSQQEHMERKAYRPRATCRLHARTPQAGSIFRVICGSSAAA